MENKKTEWPILWAFLIFIPALLAFYLYHAIKPSFETPVEPRQVHPVPPASFRAFNQSYFLPTLENPIRTEFLAKAETDVEAATDTYQEQVPRMSAPKVSKAVISMKDKIQSQRAKMTGAEIYQFRCAICHGEEGDGDGIAAEFLYPKPRNFTNAIFKYKTSPGELPARNEDLFNTIKYGLTGTSMPAWNTLLTDEQINRLIPVIKRFDMFGIWLPEEADEDEDFDDEGRYIKNDFKRITEIEPTETQTDYPYSAESIVLGKIAFEKTCRQCHGNTGRGNITSGKRLADDWQYRLWPRDLTKPWTWRVSHISDNNEKSRAETIRQIYTLLSIGIPGTPMPAHRSTSNDPDPVSLADRWHIANYVYSLRENPPSRSTVIKGARVADALPTTIDDAAWNNAPTTTMRLVPNIIKEERLFTPLSDAITARVLYNQDDIAFLLEMNDRTDSRPGEPVSEGIQDEEIEMQSDAFAIQFPKAEFFETTPIVKKPLYRHGDSVHPTTIWYWNAGSIQPELAHKYMIFNEKCYDKPLEYRSNDNSLIAIGSWEDGRWRILMKRPREGGNSGDVSFTESQFIPISFANWDGSNGETGSKHTLTGWYWLLLSPQINYNRLYGIPLGIGFLTFLLGIFFVRSQRRKVV